MNIREELQKVRARLAEIDAYICAAPCLEDFHARVCEAVEELRQGPGYDVARILDGCRFLERTPTFCARTEIQLPEVKGGYITVDTPWPDNPARLMVNRHFQPAHDGNLGWCYDVITYSTTHVMVMGRGKAGHYVSESTIMSWADWVAQRDAYAISSSLRG